MPRTCHVHGSIHHLSGERKQQHNNYNRNARRPNAGRNANTASARSATPRPSIIQNIGRRVRQAVDFKGAVARTIGARLGSRYGPVGQYVGEHLGNAFYNATGVGAYRRGSSGRAAGNPRALPSFRTGAAVTISHIDQLGVVSGSVGFNSTIYYVNPGMASTFPWLSQLARSFTSFRIRQMIFTFTSTSGTAVSNTNPALGAVMMATQYDVSTAPFATSAQLLNHQYSANGRTSNTLQHGIECKMATNPLLRYYNNDTFNLADPNCRFDFPCFVQVSTEGCPADGNPIGRLSVSYTVEFSMPEIPRSIAGSTSVFSIHSSNPEFRSNIANTTYCDVPEAYVSTTTLGANNTPHGHITLPSGYYSIYRCFACTATNIESSTTHVINISMTDISGVVLPTVAVGTSINKQKAEGINVIDQDGNVFYPGEVPSAPHIEHSIVLFQGGEMYFRLDWSTPPVSGYGALHAYFIITRLASANAPVNHVTPFLMNALTHTTAEAKAPYRGPVAASASEDDDVVVVPASSRSTSTTTDDTTLLALALRRLKS